MGSHLFSELLSDLGGLGATGPGVREPSSGLRLATGSQHGLGLPLLGPQFLSCHGSRLGHTGKHQQERPWGKAGEIRCVAGLRGSAVTWGPETSLKGTKTAQPQLLSARQELAASAAILKFQEQPDIQTAM